MTASSWSTGSSRRPADQEGKSEQESVAAKPFTDFDKQVGANEQQSTNFVRVIYNSLKPASAAPKT